MLLDESGFFLNPLVRRTWAPTGKTPILPSWGRHRDQVSLIAALSVAPTLRRLGRYWRWPTPSTTSRPKRWSSSCAGCFQHLRGRVIVVWDGGTNHQGPLIRAFCARHPRLHLERLPAYAPNHNPVEFLWGHLKHARLPNFVPESWAHLDQTIRHELDGVRQTPGLLKALC